MSRIPTIAHHRRLRKSIFDEWLPLGAEIQEVVAGTRPLVWFHAAVSVTVLICYVVMIQLGEACWGDIQRLGYGTAHWE